MTALDEAAKSASAGRTAVSRGALRQEEEHVSLTSQAGEPGLPLAFGDVERPVRPVRRVDNATQTRAPVDYEKLLVPVFFVAAVCILAFTSMRLWGERVATEPVVSEEAAVVVEEAVPDVAPTPTPTAVKVAPPPPVEKVTEIKPESVPVEVRTEVPPAAPTTLPGEGHVTISSIPTARGYIDGEFADHPRLPTSGDAGSRQIELRAKDGRTHRFQAFVTAPTSIGSGRSSPIRLHRCSAGQVVEELSTQRMMSARQRRNFHRHPPIGSLTSFMPPKLAGPGFVRSRGSARGA